MAKLSDLKKLLDAARPPDAPPAVPARSSPTSSSPASTGISAAAAKTPSKSPPKDGITSASRTRRALAADKHADGDVDLTRAFADVQRLPPTNRAAPTRERPTPVARNTLADERDVLEASKYGNDPAPQTWDVGQEFEQQQSYVRSGIGADVAGKLRRGFWSVQAELDLHGQTADGAHDALADFLVECRGHGLRCVRVIHGKGLTSPGREPVLKGKVRRWLAHWDEVLAYVEAPQHAGGGGAVIVLLKGS